MATIGEVMAQEETARTMMPKGVTCDTYKDFQDFIVYCDVMNNHPANRPHSVNGVADILLDHHCYGIFDAHTNKGYVIDGDIIEANNPAENASFYTHRQVKRCRAKYPVDPIADAHNDNLFNGWVKMIREYEA